MVSRNASSSGAPSSSTARMAAMRPRGESALEPGDPVGRAVREAEAARHARDQLVLVDRQDAGVAGARAGAGATSTIGGVRGQAAGRALAGGVERGADARREPRVRAAATPKPSRPGAPASRSSQPPAASAATRGPRQRGCVVGRDVHGARRRPRPASARRSASSAGASSRERRRSHRDPAAVRARRATPGAARGRGRADPRALGVDVGGDAFEQHVRAWRRPTRGTTAGTARRAARTGRRRS